MTLPLLMSILFNVHSQMLQVCADTFHIYEKPLDGFRIIQDKILRHDPQLRIGPSMPIILQMCAPKHATFV